MLVKHGLNGTERTEDSLRPMDTDEVCSIVQIVHDYTATKQDQRAHWWRLSGVRGLHRSHFVCYA